MFQKKEKLLLSSFDFSKIQPLENAFAHNDEQYNYPLLGALKLGFTYAEVDIHLIKNEIYVSHRKPFFPNYNNTLTKLYLEPLFYFFQKYNSSIFQNKNETFNLILDIKTEANTTYEVLKKHLKPFHSMLSSWENLNVEKKPINIHLSGNRPINSVVSEKKRYVLLDGRTENLDKNYSSELIPMISEKYSKIFGYSLFFKMPSEKKMEKFRQLADKIHNQNKLFRLWKIPENEHVWALLLNNGLDLISTDRIQRLNNFLRKN